MGDWTLSFDAPVTNDQLNDLFAAAWPNHRLRDIESEVRTSFVTVTAWDAGNLVGLVKLVSDGALHGFLLDTTVHPSFQRRGLGVAMVIAACQYAKKHGIEWVHVDYEPQLAPFYAACGFRATTAGVMNLKDG